MLIVLSSQYALGESLTPPLYSGIVVLIVGSSLICLIDGNLYARWITFAKMFVGG